jgi:mono/diheme cytochrome c family protein
MNNTRTLLQFSFAAVAASLVSGVHAANLDAGKKRASEVCVACHGIDGCVRSPFLYSCSACTMYAAC